MKISAKLDYALRLLVSLTHSTQPLTQTAEVASTENVSLKFLQSIVKDLKDHQIIETYFGPHGGVKLARPAIDISFLEIYEIFHEDLRVVEPCVEFQECGHLNACGIQKILRLGQMKMRDYFASIKLSDLSQNTALLHQ